jgi:hypothetical protein
MQGFDDFFQSGERDLAAALLCAPAIDVVDDEPAHRARRVLQEVALIRAPPHSCTKPI